VKKSEIQANLYTLAVDAMKRAYNPYSRYSVGAALQTTEGIIQAGCNVENVSYRLTLCAEANAIGALVAKHGHAIVQHILIVASGTGFPSPCGACRQIIAEFSQPETEVHLARTRENGEGFDVRTYRISALLPLSFSQSILQEATVPHAEIATPSVTEPSQVQAS